MMTRVPPVQESSKYVGKLEQVTNLNSSAIYQGIIHLTNHHLWVSVVGWGRDQIYPELSIDSQGLGFATQHLNKWQVVAMKIHMDP